MPRPLQRARELHRGGDTTRESDWSLPHLIQDTRTSKLTAGFYSLGVCAFTHSGPNCYLHPGFTLPDIHPYEDYRWWTAAITVKALPAGRQPTPCNPPRGKSRHSNKVGKWVPKNLHKRTTVTVDGSKDDTEDFGPIQTTAFQIVDELEELPAQSTMSLDRRWRAATSLFSKRCFTNDPDKVAELRNLYL